MSLKNRILLLVQLFVGIIDSLIGILSLGFVITSFEMNIAAYRILSDIRRKRNENI